MAPWLHRISSLWIVASVLSFAAGGRAQPTSTRALIVANDLYEQAAAAMKAGDFTAACPKLEQVVRLAPDGVGGRVALASCYEADGRLASAWSAYLLAGATAARMGQPQRQRLARARAEALRPRLARLSLVIPDAVRALPGLTITCDEVPIVAAQWDAPFPVDRGAHRITASADGRRTWEARADLEADGRTVRFDVGEPPAIEPAPEADPSILRSRAPAPPGAQAPRSRASSRPARSGAGAGGSPRWSTQQWIGAFVGGVGLLGLGAGGVAGGVALAKKQSSDEEGRCRGDLCTGEGLELRAESRLAGTLSTAAFIAGAVSLAGGITVFLTAPDAEPRTGARIVLGPQRIDLRATW